LDFAAQATFAMSFLAAVCRPGGLGAGHFGWNQETLARFRRAIHWFLAVYIPAFLLTSSCAYGAASDYFDSLGRVCFILAHVWSAIILWRLFQGSNGILATFIPEHPTSLVTRWRHVWFPLLLAIPLLLVVFASLGYLITAVEFSLGFLKTLTLIAGGSVCYGLALRWFTMKQRELALAEAIERRRSRQEAAASGKQQEQSGEVVSVDLEDEEERHLDSISEQTRALLRLLFSLAVGVAIILFWSETFPLIEVVDSIPIPRTEGLTLLGLLEALLIGIVTYITVRNLPGLLELGVLRAKTVEAGTRHAISTLCQYAVTAIGLTLLLNTLNADWAKFGWIAAALSVGLGFGLQEVVANFVCGLIVLLERPIRVGDVVTVEGMIGTVTKIQMRATTITNWDRQEFVVPNKTLITSTLLNWTLSAPLNRILIPVGVAYGSDTERARQILIDVAADHPRVLEDPAPSAAFEQFADSSLNLALRAYLPDLENRIETITELHTEINKRFAAAGIEIAFPQHDIHLRGGWDDTRRQSADGPEGA
jgi:potassium efflux system protein